MLKLFRTKNFPKQLTRSLIHTRMSIKYLTQKEAQEIDIELMSPKQGFSIDQLMELAGLSVAMGVAKCFPDRQKFEKILVVVGPGNNGGDGLVAARHLHHFGYKPCIVYPKRTEKVLYQNLVTQCKQLDIKIMDSLPDDLGNFNLIIDSIFGFSFSGNIRPPFDSIIKAMNESKLPIVSVDIPSGWDVEKGNISGAGINPKVLISLTAPKLCAKNFTGIHLLGGRFVPDEMANRYQLNLPKYHFTDLIVEL